MIKLHIIILGFMLLTACNNKMIQPGEYHNSTYYMDAPVNILYLAKSTYFSIVYPSVIGEKELGIWKIEKDTLKLYVKSELRNNFKDTIEKDTPLVNMYLIKKKSLHSIDNKWVFRKK